MTMNIGSGYPVMSGMYGMSGMTGSGGMSGSSSNFLYFKSKYGCEDCFRDRPYFYQIPKPVMPRPIKYANPNFWQRLLNKILA